MSGRALMTSKGDLGQPGTGVTGGSKLRRKDHKQTLSKVWSQGTHTISGALLLEESIMPESASRVTPRRKHQE